MKTFETRQKDIFLSTLIYSVLGFIFIIIVFYVIIPMISDKSNGMSNPEMSVILIFIAVSIPQVIRMYRRKYTIADEYLHIHDFIPEYLNINNDIKKITVLDKKKWFTFRDPYTIIIELNSGRKLYISTRNDSELVSIIEDMNPSIEICRNV